MNNLAESASNDEVVSFDTEELNARIGVGRRVLEIQSRLARTIAELREAMSQIRTLRGIVPICMHCKNIRDDKGFWNRVEMYVSEHSDAQFSHGICPDCLRKHFPEVAKKALACAGSP